MDNVDRRRDIAGKIRALASEAGLLPSDPIGPVIDALADIPDEIDLRLAPIIARVEQAAAKIEASTPQAGSSDELRRAVIQGIATYARPLIQATNRRTTLLGALSLLGIGLTAFAMGYGVHRRITPPPPDLTCEEHRGGRVCFIWTKLPNEPVEPQPAPPAGPVPQQQGQALPANPSAAIIKARGNNGR